jgi:hypothetical protein
MVAKKYPTLGLHLRMDILGGVKALESDPVEQDLIHEALELLLNIASIKELYAYCDS